MVGSNITDLELQFKPKRTPLWAWSDDAYVSAWSVMHFLSGYLWNVTWSFAFDGDLPVLNLALFVVLALLFELVENQPKSGRWMWGWLGYDEESYQGDSALNSVSDVLISVAGWGAVYAVVANTRSMAALGALLGVAGTLFVFFLYLFRVERQKFREVTTESEPSLPSTLPTMPPRNQP